MSGDLAAFLRMQRAMLRERGVAGAWRVNGTMYRSRAASRRTLRSGYYRLLSEQALRARRRSSRAFVFGSGYSLNELTEQDWNHIAAYDTVGFNAFVFARWVRVDFHIVRGWGEGSVGNLPDRVADFSSAVAANSQYRDTVFVFQDDYFGQFAHSLIASRALPRGTAVFPYRTSRTSTRPTRRFEDGLVHVMGTLCDAVNFAVCLDFAEIVLVGVDLYDSRYFWVDRDKTIAIDPQTGERRVGETTTRGRRFDQPHSTAVNGVVDLMGTWTTELAGRGIRLSVYNPRSLLADVMPVYAPGEPRTAPALPAAAGNRRPGA